jgi:hypothetical protein
MTAAECSSAPRIAYCIVDGLSVRLAGMGESLSQVTKPLIVAYRSMEYTATGLEAKKKERMTGPGPRQKPTLS